MIRMLKKEDIEQCLNLYNWYIINSTATFETEVLSLDAFTQRVHHIQKRYPWIVLEEEGKIKGYAYLDAFHERAAYNWTCDLSIYLDHEQRGKGYGKQLMNAIIELAKEDGYHNIVSIVTEGNKASEAMHASFGFEKKGFFPQFGYKHHKWAGVTYFVKTLKEGINGTELEQPFNKTV